MEAALTPLEFARRARKLYGDREAVVDGDLRLNYEQFMDRCDRWSSALQGLDVKKGDEIIFSKYGGTEVKLSGDEYLILRESDILAKVVTSKVAAKA